MPDQQNPPPPQDGNTPPPPPDGNTPPPPQDGNTPPLSQGVNKDDKKRRWWEFVIENLLSVTLSICLLAFIVVLLTLFATRPDGIIALLDKLQDANYARGVITFVVVIFAVSGGLILIVFGLIKSKDDPNDPKFQRAREVFSVFGSLLATIVGFYYGTSSNQEGLLTLNIKEPIEYVSRDGKNMVSIIMSAEGSKPPYRFIVKLEGNDQEESVESDKGLWQYDVQSDDLKAKAKDNDNDGKISVDITVVDSNAKKSSASTKIKLPTSPPPPPPPPPPPQ